MKMERWQESKGEDGEKWKKLSACMLTHKRERE